MMLSWFRGGAPPCASAGGAGRVQPLHDLLDLQQPAVAARFFGKVSTSTPFSHTALAAAESIGLASVTERWICPQ